MVLPILFITSGDPGTNIDSYFFVGALISVICLISVIFMIFGMREDKDMIARTFRISENQEEKESFIPKLKFALKQKNFVA